MPYPEYAKAIEETKRVGKQEIPKTVLVIDPTHKDGDALSEKLREVRKAKGLITGEEKLFPQLTALGWTEAQKGDARQYAGNEVVQFFKNTGKFKAGERVTASELLPHLSEVNPKLFSVYRAGEVNFAVGDTVRITTNGRDVARRAAGGRGARRWPQVGYRAADA